MIIIFNKRDGQGLSFWLKILCGSPTISTLLSETFIKTYWLASTVTSTKQLYLMAIPFLKFRGLSVICLSLLFIASATW
jgi:hypothetical protein